MSTNNKYNIILKQHHKILQTIDSCKTIAHIDSTERMISNLANWWVSEEPVVKPFEFKSIAEPLERVLILTMHLNHKRNKIYNEN